MGAFSTVVLNDLSNQQDSISLALRRRALHGHRPRPVRISIASYWFGNKLSGEKVKSCDCEMATRLASDLVKALPALWSFSFALIVLLNAEGPPQRETRFLCARFVCRIDRIER